MNIYKIPIIYKISNDLLTAVKDILIFGYQKNKVFRILHYYPLNANVFSLGIPGTVFKKREAFKFNSNPGTKIRIIMF